MKTKLYGFMKLLLLGAMVFFTSCDRDEEGNVTRKGTGGITSKRISYEEFKRNTAAFGQLAHFKEENTASQDIHGKMLYDAAYGFFIDTDEILYLEKDGKVSFTFPMYRNGENEKVENLVISEKEAGAFESYVFKYSLTDQEKKTLYEKTGEVNLSGKMDLEGIGAALRGVPQEHIYQDEQGNCWRVDHIWQEGGVVKWTIVKVDCDGNNDGSATNTPETGGGIIPGFPQPGWPQGNNNEGNAPDSNGGGGSGFSGISEVPVFGTPGLAAGVDQSLDADGLLILTSPMVTKADVLYSSFYGTLDDIQRQKLNGTIGLIAQIKNVFNNPELTSAQKNDFAADAINALVNGLQVDFDDLFTQDADDIEETGNGSNDYSNDPLQLFPDHIMLADGTNVSITFGHSSDGVSARQEVKGSVVEGLKTALETANQNLSAALKIHSIYIKCTSNGEHSAHSNHPRFEAVDISKINGKSVLALGNSPQVHELQLGFIGCANGRENYGPAFQKKRNVDGDWFPHTAQGHRNHIHFATRKQP